MYERIYPRHIAMPVTNQNLDLHRHMPCSYYVLSELV